MTVETQDTLEAMQITLDNNMYDLRTPEQKARIDVQIRLGNLTPPARHKNKSDDDKPYLVDPIDYVPEQLTPLERVGHGMYSMYSGTKQLLPESWGGYSPKEIEQINKGREVYDKGFAEWNSERDPETGELKTNLDQVSMVGQGLASLPLMAIPGSQAGTVARLGASGLAGGLGGGLMYEEDINDKMINAGVGTVGGVTLGAALPPLARFGGKLAGIGWEAGRRGLNYGRSVLPRLQSQIMPRLTSTAAQEGLPLDRLGVKAAESMRNQATQSIRATGAYDPAALARRANIEAAGFTGNVGPTTGQVTRDPRVLGAERNLAKTEFGTELMDRFMAQQSKAKNWLQKLQIDTFGDEFAEVTPADAMMKVQRFAINKAKAWQTKVSEMYKQLPGGALLSKQSLHNRTSQILRDFEGDIKPGVLTKIRDIVDNDTRAFTMDRWVELDQLITKTTGSDKTAQLASGELRKAIIGVLDDSSRNVADDLRPIYKAATQEARRRFAAMGRNNEFLAKVMNGGIKDNQFVGAIKNSSVKEMTHALDFLDEASKKQIRISLLNDIVENSMTGENFSQAAFNRNLNKIAREKLDVLYGVENRMALKGFGRAVQDLMSEPNFSTTNFSNTANAVGDLVKRLYRGLIEEMPGGRLASSLMNEGKKISPHQQQIIDLAKQGGVPTLPRLRSTPSIIQPTSPSYPALSGGAPFGGQVGANSLDQN